MSLTTCPFQLVCFRAADGVDYPAVIMREHEDAFDVVVDLVAFIDTYYPDDVSGTMRAATPIAIAKVRRGVMDGTEARPSWYPIDAHPLKASR